MERDNALSHDRIVPLPCRPYKYRNNNQLTMATGGEAKGEGEAGEGGREEGRECKQWSVTMRCPTIASSHSPP